MNSRILLTVVTVAAAAVLAAACASGCTSDEASAGTARTSATARTTQPVTPPSTQMTSLTGTLRGGMMAIGGETTGWKIVGDGATGGVELDVSRVRDDVNKLDGRRVTVSGQMIDRKYVERGTVRMMRVETIREAK